TVADSSPGSQNERGARLSGGLGSKPPFGSAASPLSSPGREPPSFVPQGIPEAPTAIASDDTGPPATTVRHPAAAGLPDRAAPASKEAGGGTPAGARGAGRGFPRPPSPAGEGRGKRAPP